MKGGTTDRRGDRGASTVLAVVLLVAVVFAGTAMIYVTASATQEQAERKSNTESATTTMYQFGTKLSTLRYAGDRTTTSIELGGDPTKYDVEEDGEIEFRLNGRADCAATRGLGSIVYDQGEDGTIAYQAGGIWRSNGDSSTVLSQPSIRYYTEEFDGSPVRLIDFPVDRVAGNVSGTEQTLQRRDDGKALHEELCLPVSDHDVEFVDSITIYVNGTSYHDAWVDSLESEFGPENVDHDPFAEWIRVDAPLGPQRGVYEHVGIEPTVYGGLYGVDLQSTSNAPVRVTNEAGERDWVFVENDLKMTHGLSGLDANVVVGGDFENGPCPEGALYVGGGAGGCPRSGTTGGTAVEPIDDELDEALADHFRDAPDPNGTLTAGAYRADSLATSEFDAIDTTEGSVEIGVDGDLVVDESLTVAGDDDVRFYVTGDVIVSSDIDADSADQVWIYAPSDAEVSIEDDTTVTGVVYAPQSDLELGRDVTIEGAVAGGEIQLRPGSKEITIDEDLRTAAPSLEHDRDGEVHGPNGPNVVSFDSKVTVLGAELSGVWRDASIDGETRDVVNHAPVSIQLRTEDDDGQHYYSPFPDGDPETFDHSMTHDVNDPTLPMNEGTNPVPSTYGFTDLKPGTSFTVYATSYHCTRGYHATDSSRPVDDEELTDVRCDGIEDGDQRLEINTDDAVNEENVKILSNGEYVPHVDAAGPEQRSLNDLLGEKLAYDAGEEMHYLDLEEGEYVMLFELSDDSATWEKALNRDDPNADPDYNDAVVLYEITDVETTETATLDETGRSSSDYSFVVQITGGEIVVG